ncbi:hypothetical protein [Paraliomyxa miuraensis]|uniref:hypothetical protein n=1 Tax=Paraliomyxa miuraensis TaxID=376150 RepID=UPI002259F773|nr:hypothetical protein [Paraliomyxa miuraensis]MCX4240108.1 hypothetical protein [Paraliomyxa miuraensis]
MRDQLSLDIIKQPTDVLSWGTWGELMITFAVEGEMPESRLVSMLDRVRDASPKRVIAASLGRYKMTSVQRKQTREAYGELDRIATITDDPITRGIITAFGWLGMNIKSFPWTNLREACDYIAPSGATGQAVFDSFSHIRELHMAIVEKSNPNNKSKI